MNKRKLNEVKEAEFEESNLADQNKMEAEEDEAKLTVPDGGYGWFVVFGCFLLHVVTGGIERSDGVFFLQLTSRFGQSAQLTSWPGAIMSTLNLCLGPIAGAICNRHSVRTSVMIGGLLMATGCILNGFASNFYFLFFSHSLLVGAGRGLSYAPSLIIVAMYFDKRRALATGIGTSGVGIGTFLLVPIAQFLFDNYGFQGAFLIFGGIALNTNVAAMVYRPLSMHYRFMKRSRTRIYSVDHVDAAEAIVASETISEIGSLWSLQTNPVEIRRTQEIRSLTSSNDTNIIATDLGKEPFLGNNWCTTALKICFPTEVKNSNDKKSRKLCHFYLLKNSSFLFYCLSMWVFSMAMKSGYTFIPALVNSKGITDSKASLVLSITGVVDCVSRIGAGFLLDLKLLRRHRLLIYTAVILALSCVVFILPSMDSFTSFLVTCCVFGFFTGIYVSQKSVILVDILDIQHMTNSLGILICFQSFGTLLGPPLSGAVKDYFGTFAEAFYLNGGFMVAAGVLMFASNMCLGIQGRTRNLRE
ncbi:unnamed protein product [Candidula unifasciata]|uniref:Major facilitator superfamily (MFS) profile domain-containing protein n=1 Tax=Candidula unifasciata TaxID=100452 RepID=A0A8S3ZBX2_9EUPU|nr:unnamed protein product [Candidula unifasciata]